MSTLSNLFVSYNFETPTIPEKYYLYHVPNFLNSILFSGTLDQPSNSYAAPTIPEPVATRVKRILWVTGGLKGPEYSNSDTTTTTLKNTQQTKAATVTGNWKAEMFSAYKRAGCSDTFARNLIGQDALETGWGQHIVGDYNYGNIKTGKSWEGRSRKAHDKREGSYDAYRSYDSVDHYVQDKLDLLNRRYGITGNETPEQFTDKLVAGGYATSKNYRESVLRTIKSI